MYFLWIVRISFFCNVPVLSLLVPAWCCSRFLALFADYTHKSVAATEIFDIVAVAALLMFLFYQSMFFAGINNTGAVRKSTVYAMVFIMLGLTVAIDLFIKMSMPSNAVSGIDSEVVMPTLSNILTYAGDISLCVYALFFSLSNIKVADKTAVIPEPDEEETEKTDKNVTLDEKTDESTEDKKENKEKEDVKPVEATPIEEKKSDE